MGDKRCKRCEEPLKLKHLLRAKENHHRPPDFCYPCLRETQGKKSSKERKIELAKKRAREREALKKGLSGGAG